MSSRVLNLPAEQKHLLAHFEKLNEAEQQQLTAQIEKIDFSLMQQLFSGSGKAVDWTDLSSRADAPPAFRLGSAANRFSVEQAAAEGEKALQAGRLGAIVVAGGQGSRLGFEHPKGMYPIGPISERTLFQFHIEQIRAMARRYDVSNSTVSNDQPGNARRNGRVSRKEQSIRSTGGRSKNILPRHHASGRRANGRIAISGTRKSFRSPNGHGGTLAALVDNGCLADMQSRGITELFYFQVDNPIVEICQPELIGYHLLSKSEMTTQVAAKSDPMEKVGNIVTIDGKMTVIEYSDLPEGLGRSPRRG